MQAPADRDGADEPAHGANQGDHTLGEVMGRSSWPELPEVIRAGIVPVVKASTEKE